MNANFDIPKEIWEAAIRVERFMKIHGLDTWELAGICSRNHAYKWNQTLKEVVTCPNCSMEFKPTLKQNE